jgi:hypothetical protein
LGILHVVRKSILLEVKKAKIGSQSPKMEFGAQNQYGRVIHLSIGNFTCSKKKYTFGGQKGEKGSQSQKLEFGAQNQYGRVTYPSFDKKAKISLQSPKTEFGAQNQ